jgi:hypothetical protein
MVHRFTVSPTANAFMLAGREKQAFLFDYNMAISFGGKKQRQILSQIEINRVDPVELPAPLKADRTMKTDRSFL